MSYYFEGDLCQMSKQRELLSGYGINVIMSNVYPTVETEEEYKDALSLIWRFECEGWWHYEEKYIKYDICKKSSFVKRLCGNLYLKHMIDKELIPSWDKWWELIESEDIKINDIPVKTKRIKNDYGEMTRLVYNGIEADNDNNVIVQIGDKITVADKEFVIN